MTCKINLSELSKLECFKNVTTRKNFAVHGSSKMVSVKRLPTFTTRSRGIKNATNSKLKKLWRSSSRFATPGRTKNTIYERYVFFSRNQHSGESIDHYVTALKILASTCEFGALKESLIRTRIVFGIQDSSVRERLLRDTKLTVKPWKLQSKKSGHPNSLKSN